MIRFFLSLLAVTGLFISPLPGNGDYNVLMIIVDDLRPELGCYGSEAVKTPNMDRLAGQGILFDRAYCQEAICMASRASLLTGMYPVAVNGYNFRTRVDKGLPGIVAIPEFFRNNGWYTVGINKDFHHFWFEQQNWDEHHSSPTPGSDWRNYVTPENQAIQQRLYAEARERDGEDCRFNPDNLPAASAVEAAPDELAHLYVDSQATELAIRKLREIKDRRFFLSVGYRKPHLPFNAPQRYFDLFPLESIRLPENMTKPGGASEYAFMDSFELRAYSDIPDCGPVVGDEWQARRLLQAYYACVAYVDDRIGQLLDELDRQGLRDNTIVILWGDHGFKLGEHSEWGKHSNFEVDLRSPLIIRAPVANLPTGKSSALVEFVDVYPTIVELCGLTPPRHLEGRSLLPLLEDPDSRSRSFAFSQYPRTDGIMGYSLRTDAWRYTEWIDTRDGSVLGNELFDHRSDPLETVNLAERKEHTERVGEFRAMIADKLDAIHRGRAGSLSAY